MSCIAVLSGGSWRCWRGRTRLRRERWLLRKILLGTTFAASLMAADFDWNLPKGFPRPVVPADNPMSASKVELGRYLFYDKGMSVNGRESAEAANRQDRFHRRTRPCARNHRPA